MSEQIPATENNSVAKDMGILGRLVGVFTSPGATFQSIAQKPGWFIPLLILIAISLGNIYLLTPTLVKENQIKSRAQMEKRGLEGDQLETAMEKSESMMKMFMYPGAIIGTFIVILITAGVWIFLSNTVLGGQASYKQMLSVVTYTQFIGLVGGLIKMPIMISQGTMNVHFSLATFMSDELVDTFLYKFLMNIELFNIWTVITLSIGIAVVAKLGVKKVWPWVAIVFLLFFAGSAALGSAFGG